MFRKAVSKIMFVLLLIVIFIVVIGGVGNYSQRGSEKKPVFNVFDVRPYSYGCEVYVQNIGSKDAYDVRVSVQVKTATYWEEWSPWLSTRIDVLRVGEIRKVVLESEYAWGEDLIEFKVTVYCPAEGVKQDFYFKR